MVSDVNSFDRLFIGRSPELMAVLRTAQVAAAADVTVLVQGESGTGKELLAQAVHRHSRRAGGPFVTINCAALPEGLVESELFGHRRGAFTGAALDQPGRLKAADRGTLFLDEIGELPFSAQGKLLRFIETGEVQSVGHASAQKVDARIVAATNRDLMALVKAGRFREDLFYRLNVVPLELPPLRARTGDLPILLAGLTERFAHEHGLDAPRFSEAAQAALARHAWPGNVRELRNFCERMVVLFGGRTVEVEHLPRDMVAAAPADAGVLASLGLSLPEGGVDMEQLEVALIRLALDKTAGNRSRAARLLGLTRDTLLYRMKKHALS